MTQQYNNYERELDWEDTIQQDAQEFILLEAGGLYQFTVEKFERARHNGSEKIPPCNKAIVKLKVETPQGIALLNYNLFLHSKMEGMLSAFFGAIGQKKHGENLKMNWQHVIGATGVCKVKHREYNGNQYNEVQAMIYAEDVDPTKVLNMNIQGNHQVNNAVPQSTNGWKPGSF